VRRRSTKSAVKYGSSTVEVLLILVDLSTDEVGGMDGVAVKCLEIVQNTDSEGSLLRSN
jgi:hypothetical protein